MRGAGLVAFLKKKMPVLDNRLEIKILRRKYEKNSCRIDCNAWTKQYGNG